MCEIEVASKLFCREINVWLECINQNGYISYVRSNFKPDNLNHPPLHLLLKNQHYQSPVLVKKVYLKDSMCQNQSATKQNDDENLNTNESALAKDRTFSEHNYASTQIIHNETQSEKQNEHVHSSHSGRRSFRAQRRNASKNKNKNLNALESTSATNNNCSSQSCVCQSKSNQKPKHDAHESQNQNGNVNISVS